MLALLALISFVADLFGWIGRLLGREMENDEWERGVRWNRDWRR